MDEKKEKETFQGKLARLETLLSKVESNALPLEESMAAYEEGMKLIKECEETLSNAKAKVLKISGSDKEQ